MMPADPFSASAVQSLTPSANVPKGIVILRFSGSIEQGSYPDVSDYFTRRCVAKNERREAYEAWHEMAVRWPPFDSPLGLSCEDAPWRNGSYKRMGNRSAR